MEPTKVVRCDCGFEAIGTDDELIALVGNHARDEHGIEVLPEQVLVTAFPVDGPLEEGPVG